MRVPPAFPLLVLLVSALAGCSGGDDQEPANRPLSSAPSTSAAPPPPPLPTSDTLHFLAAPEMAPALPDGGSEVSTPVTVGNFGNGQGPEAQGAEWRYKVERATNVSTGEVHIWIEIKETLLHMPDNQALPSCTWSLTVALGADNPEILGCIQEPPGPINPGVKELTFTVAPASPIELEANETVTVRLERAGFSLSANNAVDAKSGSADRDSRIRLQGLKEPIRD